MRRYARIWFQRSRRRLGFRIPGVEFDARASLPRWRTHDRKAAKVMLAADLSAQMRQLSFWEILDVCLDRTFRDSHGKKNHQRRQSRQMDCPERMLAEINGKPDGSDEPRRSQRI